MNDLSNLRILYEDEFLIIVYKDYGVLSQKDNNNAVSINETVLSYVCTKYKFNYIGLLHRLDKFVAGPLIFAKDKRTAKLMSKQFSSNKIRKKYYAICFGLANEKATLVHYLLNTKEKVLVSNIEADNYKRSELDYTRLAIKTLEQKLCTILDINLITGRKHQIRIQLAEAKLPVLNDIKYGNIKDNNFLFLKDQELALCSYYISFKHPLKNGNLVEIKLPYPSSWPSF